MDTESLGKRLVERIGQTVLTCPTTNCFDGLPGAETPPNGWAERCASSATGFRRARSSAASGIWRIPVMDGECLLQESFGAAKGIGGGNFLILGADAASTLAAAEAAVAAMANMPGVILPFPGGIARSGSKSRIASLQVARRVDERCVLPDAASAHVDRRCRTTCIPCSRSCSTASTRHRFAERCALASPLRAVPGIRAITRRQLWRQARSAPLSAARDHGREPRMRERRRERTRDAHAARAARGTDRGRVHRAGPPSRR